MFLLVKTEKAYLLKFCCSDVGENENFLDVE